MTRMMSRSRRSGIWELLLQRKQRPVEVSQILVALGLGFSEAWTWIGSSGSLSLDQKKIV